MIEIDNGKEFENTIFTDFLKKKNNFKRYSRYSTLGVMFAERLTCTTRDRPKRPVFEIRDSDWIEKII